MWQSVVSWFKSLLGSKGGIQIGRENRSVTGSSTSHNSPVVTAGRDIHFNVPRASVADEETLAKLEKVIPDLLAELRRLSAGGPLIRDIIVLDKDSIDYTWPDPHWQFAEDKSPGVRSQIRLLENHHLIRELKDRFAYRMSEQLAGYLQEAPK